MSVATREELDAQLSALIEEHTLLAFTKGSREQPRCGFSAAVVDVLGRLGRPFRCQDVLEEEELRYALAARSKMSTLPQIFLKGELLGGCDRLHELYRSGELEKRVDEAFSGP